MKPTGINSLKAAVQRTLHPPLPLGRRQSQRLIQLISASFRQKLNEEHPQPATPQPIDAHLQAILANPLFRQSPRALRGPHKDLPASRHPTSDPENVPSLQSFNERCAQGRATLRDAAALLRPVSSLSGDQAEARSRVDAVLQWLWSSGLAESMAFVENRSFVSALTRALATVDRADVLWKWQQSVVERYTSDPTQSELTQARWVNIKAASPLLQQTLRMAAVYWQTRFKLAPSVDDCAKEFLKVQSCPITNEQWRTWTVKTVAYHFIADLLDRPEPATISADLYHDLTRRKDFYNAMSSVSRASLALFAPTPDASAAYGLLSHELPWLLMPSARAKNYKRQALLALRTINVLLDQNRPQQAALIGSLVVKYLWRDPRSADMHAQVSEESQRLPSLLRDLISSQQGQFSPESG